MEIFATILSLLYLLIQSYSDAKTMQVYTVLNNVALVISIALYSWDCYTLGSSPTSVAIIVCATVMIGCVLGYYGIGDAKAMIAIYFSQRYFFANFPHPDTAAFLLTMLIANVTFLVYFKIKDFIKKEQRKRAAYFPFLTLGYASSLFLGIMSTQNWR